MANPDPRESKNQQAEPGMRVYARSLWKMLWTFENAETAHLGDYVRRASISESDLPPWPLHIANYGVITP